jgi:hypothetical protein
MRSVVYAKCRAFLIIILSVVMPSVVMLNVVAPHGEQQGVKTQRGII